MSDPTPTPLTDAALDSMRRDAYSFSEFVDHARTLERANAELRAEVEELRNVLGQTRYTATQAMDEVRAAVGAPRGADDKSSNRAVDYVRAEVERLKAAGCSDSCESMALHYLQRAERAELAADCLANLAKLLTRDDGVDPEAYWIELMPEQANLIKLVAEQRSTL